MNKKCIYCAQAIDSASVIDVCTRCGYGVWGENMFNAIKENMENAREKGDLLQGSIADSMEMDTDVGVSTDGKI